MLNPEYVDFEKGTPDRIKIGFTDEEGDQVLEIVISESDGCKLWRMIQNQTNMKAKNERKKI